MKKLSEDKKKDYQLKFLHYLKNYREKKRISQEGLADELGVAMSLIGLFESKAINNRFVSSIEFLLSLASLEKLSLKEFVTYLEEGSPSNDLLPWQIATLQAISKLNLATQAQFIHSLKTMQEKPDKVAMLFDIFNECSKRSPSQLKIVGGILEELK